MGDIYNDTWSRIESHQPGAPVKRARMNEEPALLPQSSSPRASAPAAAAPAGGGLAGVMAGPSTSAPRSSYYGGTGAAASSVVYPGAAGGPTASTPSRR